MAITKKEIRERLYLGNGGEYSHMLMVCDTFDYEDYPVFVRRGEDLNKYIHRYQNSNQMSKIMEIYNYDLDLEYQLNEHRAWHIDSQNTSLKKEEDRQGNTTQTREELEFTVKRFLEIAEHYLEQGKKDFGDYVSVTLPMNNNDFKRTIEALKQINECGKEWGINAEIDDEGMSEYGHTRCIKLKRVRSR